MSRITISIEYEILVKARNIQGKAQQKTTGNVTLSQVFETAIKHYPSLDLTELVIKESEKN